MRQAHVKLIAAQSVRNGIRGGAGLVAIFMTLIVGLICAYIAMLPLEIGNAAKKTRQYQQMSAEERAIVDQQIELSKGESVRAATKKVVEWGLDFDDDALDYVTKDHPVIITLFMILLFVCTPALICLAGFNQTSSDIDSKGLRFLLIRTERTNIFIGRFLGTYLYTAVVFLLLFAILGLYMLAKVDVHGKGEMAWWLFQGYLRVLILGLPYMAVCSWVSCMLESAFGSLAISLLLVYFIPALIGIAGMAGNLGWLHWAQLITPWGWKWWLLGPVGPKFIGALVGMVGFTAAFLFLGNRYFGKRDL